MPPQFENNIPSIDSVAIPKPRSKHTSLIVFGMALVLISVLIIGYFWYKSRQTVIPTQNQNLSSISPSDKFTDWKTYRNDEYGFELKYPKEWFIQTEDKSSGRVTLASSPKEQNAHGIGLPPIGSMWVQIFKDVNAKGIGCAPTSDFVSMLDVDQTPQIPILAKTSCKNGFEVVTGLWSSNPNLQEDKTVLDQIFSTFKFTK